MLSIDCYGNFPTIYQYLNDWMYSYWRHNFKHCHGNHPQTLIEYISTWIKSIYLDDKEDGMHEYNQKDVVFDTEGHTKHNFHLPARKKCVSVNYIQHSWL